MSRLQAIEQALLAINQAAFQELCDSFLTLRNNNYLALSRTGSQSGKQKTVKGTPDTFFLLPNGKYLFVEYSTNSSAGLSKLKDDVNKCIDESKTGIPVKQIAEIIICVNFNLKANDIQELVTILANTRIVLTVYTLHSLAIELHLNHRDLTQEYLNLSLDTGQIVSIEKFINEYNRVSKGISTPLDNTFLHREQELKELKELIHKSDFIILTGAPGIGKTKLALEGIKSFLAENLEYGAYCVSYKHYTLLEDLFQYIDSNKYYILFVDDANRIDAFNQITSFYNVARKGILKVIITVRDYAFQEIGILCQEFSPKRMDLKKFSDEQIIEITKAQPFEINNYKYHREIVRIADGNPRLAIMAALLAKAKQNIFALADVSELFDNYFSTFIKDDGEFDKDENIKCLGLIAFFYVIPYKNKEITSSILDHFGIEYSSFIDAIDKLDKLELVEIQFEHVKIPEQNLSTYFFYKAFLKDNLLSFEVLLNKYFESNSNRFKDCVIPTNNTFGPQRVMDKLKPYLKDYWKSIRNEEERGFKFLSIFWYYLSAETFEFVYAIVEALPSTKSAKYEVAYESNDLSYNENDIIELLGKYFRFPYDIKDAIELAFEFVRKKPKYLPELIHKIRRELTFDTDDAQYGFKRQFILLQILLDGLKGQNILFTLTFYELSKTFLQFRFEHSKSGRHHLFYFYKYPLPNTLNVHKFRSNTWNAVNENYADFPKESFELLQNYSSVSPDVIKEIMEFDIPFILKIIDNHLSYESFEHCRYVHELIRWSKRNSVSHPTFSSLAESFTNSVYETYLKIDWDWFRNNETYEYDNYREFEKLKEAEIRTSFIFNTREDVAEFFNVFSYLKEKAKNEWNYNNSLDFVIDENCSRNFELGCELLVKVIQADNKINYIPRSVFRNHLKNAESSRYIWSILQKMNFNLKANWEFSFYDYLDDSLLNKENVKSLINTISGISDSNIIHVDRLHRFLTIEPNLFQIILRKIVDKNEVGADLQVWIDFFSTHFEKLGNDVDLIMKAYLQQDRINNHFDYDGKGLLNILKKAPQFLIDYVNSLYSKKQDRLSGDHRRLGFVWRVADIEPIIIEVFDLVIEKEPYFGILEHFCNSFFRDIPKDLLGKAKKFLFGYVRKNHNDQKKMIVVVDISRNSMKEIFEDVILLFLSLNQDVDVFSKIMWRGSSGTYSGDVIIGDIEAADWRNILSIVDKSDIGIKLIPIKNYLHEEIESCLRHGDWERQRRFLERY